MKRWFKTVLSALVMVTVLIAFQMNVQAGTITSVNATSSEAGVTVSGVAADDVLSVMILIYDEVDSQLVQMQSVAVNEEHKYTSTFDMEAGKYIVKAADYEGGAFSETKVVVEEKADDDTKGSSTDNTNNNTNGENVATKTGDQTNMQIWVVALVVSLAIFVVLVSKKTKRNLFSDFFNNMR